MYCTTTTVASVTHTAEQAPELLDWFALHVQVHSATSKFQPAIILSRCLMSHNTPKNSTELLCTAENVKRAGSTYHQGIR